ncbi:MAG: preprotein translocase subunit SecA [Candidatus Doudnabacteria bacterium RIFCSPLOWO2_02_FULL_42_9]|uniref:Protein translocase subunit SecA n=1 Tax=Candidatus Doudnabacteria bacterium RIFCSPHIGHO2_01_FULL_41_86 TaxID=1817821 RepID=A0A1F5N7I6_9BACT|nr:MAG: preprotein translocase subunit SecA [Candidatus Doudnabacteria bacterium RIFCSPHIGHO2_01_FULL_41_86]OGE75700.1 MAG: preprotein translocase subunit SecA [Candidatus Doudnabacteria bacterium RIFCSPHIGHO2_01_43_10]OGE85652.1 MAG: preprotein translocase subunit SecA [Candidatus Doudnabacteria bacterium RIFCSPHIGHO2_12_FULL_42_22]OGE87148.1 MAG: preprotein translocase subunit SecA [Candidatus Doudnabacteria bacterium RIFCSPHIGHO2_02_FULL_42_25]OGE91986.1 MAG: preprotein translocase subunit S
MAFFSNLFSDSNQAVVKRLQKKVDEINSLEKEFESKSQDDLKALTVKWKAQLASLDLDQQKAKLEELLPQAFAAVREASKRTIGQRHYDVQLIGGMVLHTGAIAEMRTGEGKTLVATLPLYLNALTGRGVHLVTVNDYLSRWQASWMGQIYHYLGMSVASIQHEQSFIYDPTFKPEEEEIKQIEAGVQGLVLDVKHMRPVPRRQAYASDITYGTNNEYGFDYLRDNMVWDPNQMSQRDLHYAIVDEVDSILIDEARTPLIISAPDTDSTDMYSEFAKVITSLSPDDYVVDEKKKQVAFSEKGNVKLEKKYGDAIYNDPKLRHQADAALRAKTLFKKDINYVVREGEVVIVDEFTGRLMFGRRYSEGLHQAIEAKEGVKVQQESKTLATITFQNYFRLYKKLAGMTGTAETEAEEFHKIYNLEVVLIPTHRPMIRKDLPDQVYKNVKGKFTALVRAIKEIHSTGRPILIGTISIEKNELLSQLLKQAGVPHELLNAKNNEREAHIIAQAGRLGSVTLATNIAGRGVDIILGGNPADPEEQARVKELGGLAVIGTERHESRRIDNQLRGRSGRQGDPGSSQFFLSLEDDLMRLFGGDRVGKMMETLGIPEDQPIEAALISKSIESAQKKIEGLNFDMRKHVLEYDDVMNKQRTVIYGKRKQSLDPQTDLSAQIKDMLVKEITNIVNFGLAQEQVDSHKIFHEIGTIVPLQHDVDENKSLDQEVLTQHFVNLAMREYEKKEQKLGAPVMRQLERVVYLRAIDVLWQEHLDTMEHLRDSVRLRGYGQRDPLHEFKNEGFEIFGRLLDEINRQVAYTIFRVDVTPQPVSPVTRNNDQGSEIGRNDPCPCGSGKKWKKCGLLNTEEHKNNLVKKQGGV